MEISTQSELTKVRKCANFTFTARTAQYEGSFKLEK